MDSVIKVEQRFIYSFSEKMTVKELIDSLKSYNEIANYYLPKIFRNLADIKIDNINIYIDEIEEGSIVEKFFFEFLFKDEENRKKAIIWLKDATGVSDAEEGKPMRLICTAILGSLLGIGASYLYFQKQDKSQLALQYNIDASTNINISGNINSKDIVRIVKDVTDVNKKKIALLAGKIIEPAQTRGGQIYLDDARNYAPISDETIREVDINPNLDNRPKVEVFDDIDLQIRATDLDRETGWFALIQDVTSQRVKLEISEKINKFRLANASKVRANVEVHYKISGNGERKPISIYLKSLVDLGDDE